MSRNPVRVNSTAILRTKFVDSEGLSIEATGVTVDLWEPGLDPLVDSPTVTGLVPSYKGEGVFEIQFTASSPEGKWTDRWTGNILGDVTSVSFKFDVIASGNIISYQSNKLSNNSLIQINLENIKSTSGLSLSGNTELIFTTKLEPFYSSVRKVQLEAGSLLSTLSAMSIDLAILEASLEADVLTFNKTTVNNNLFLHARRSFTTCTAVMLLAQNILVNGGVVKSKQLGDFRVEYENKAIGDLMERISACLSKWEPQLIAGGGARSIRNSKIFVKGELDPDRPATGRDWWDITPGELPVGNARYTVTPYRRFKTGWIRRNIGKFEW